MAVAVMVPVVLMVASEIGSSPRIVPAAPDPLQDEFRFPTLGGTPTSEKGDRR